MHRGNKLMAERSRIAVVDDEIQIARYRFQPTGDAAFIKHLRREVLMTANGAGS